MQNTKREIETELKRCAEYFPVVTILGPRQSGKTTLAKMFFPSYQYVNLEDPEIFALAQSDINEFFNLFKAPLIIDEIQRVPALLNKIQVLVDEKKQNGQFILTGSFQQGLKSAISQSLVAVTYLLRCGLPPALHRHCTAAARYFLLEERTTRKPRLLLVMMASL